MDPYIPCFSILAPCNNGILSGLLRVNRWYLIWCLRSPCDLGFDFIPDPIGGTFISSIELAGSMGGDEVLSEVYVPTLTIITFQLLFPGNSGAGRLAMPPKAMVSASSLVDPVSFPFGLSRVTYVISRRPLDIYHKLAPDLAPRTFTQSALSE